MDLDLLALRDSIREMLVESEVELTGCGYSFFDKIADITFKVGRRHYYMALREIDVEKPPSD